MAFLGRQKMIPKGAAVLSKKTGAPIVPVFFVRKEDNSFEFKIHEPLFPPSKLEGSEHESIVQIVKKYSSIIEQTIRQYPTQWLMFREFWKE